MIDKHTPGPWVAAEKCMHQQFVEIVHRIVAPGASSGVVARVTCRQTWQSEQLANAHLIAKAPELLKLAQRIAALNRDADEIGAGMLASLVDEARRLTA